MPNGRKSERSAILAYIRERDHEASRTLSQSRIRTLRAVRNALRELEKNRSRQNSRRFLIAVRSYSRPPPKGKFALGAVNRRGVRLISTGTTPGPNTRTPHFRLNQTPSGENAARHQHYIEREGACVASFGNISPHKSERVRFWKEIHAKTTRRKGSIRLQPEAALELKKAVLEKVDEICASMDFSEKEIERLKLLAKGTDEQIAKADITLRTSGSAQHKRWLRWICLLDKDFQEEPQDFSKNEEKDTKSPEDTEGEDTQAKKHTAWTPPGVRERKPRDGIVQRRIVLELPHETSLVSMEHSLSTWCRKNLPDVSWHAVIHRPERGNDTRNWHAHIVYSQFYAKKKTKAQGEGWQFEDPGMALPENSKTVKILTGNQEAEAKLDANGKKIPPDRKKAREDTKNLIKSMRLSVCKIYNNELQIVGSPTRYDPRSYKSMGIDTIAGKHAGPEASRTAQKGEDTSWHGYGHTWQVDPDQEKEVSDEQDAEDRARLLSSILTSRQDGQEFAHKILGENHLWTRKTRKDQEWDEILKNIKSQKTTGIPETETAKTQHEISIPDWHKEWTRIQVARTPNEDPLEIGLSAWRVLIKTPDLIRLRSEIYKTGSSPNIQKNIMQNQNLNQTIPDDYHRDAEKLCLQAQLWKQASLAWQKPANRILQDLKNLPRSEADLKAAEFLEKTNESGIPDPSLDILLDNPKMTHEILQAGTRGKRRIAAEKEILPAFRQAAEIRHRRDVLALIQPLLEKHQKHLTQDHPRRGAVVSLRLAVLENLASFRELWDAGRILEIPKHPWYSETRKALSETERTAFDQVLEENQSQKQKDLEAHNQAEADWQEFRKLNLRSTDTPDIRLAKLIQATEFNPENLLKINPRAGKLVELAFEFKKTESQKLKEITDQALNSSASPADRLKSALEISETYPKATAALAVPELSEKLGKITRQWAATLARDIALPIEAEFSPNPEESYASEDFVQTIQKQRKPSQDEMQRDRSWEIARRYGKHSKAAQNLCPFEHPILHEWLQKSLQADKDLLEKTQNLENLENPQWKGKYSQAEIRRLLDLKPGKAKHVLRILGTERISDLQNLANY